jgi:hypothetical protein
LSIAFSKRLPLRPGPHETLRIFDSTRDALHKSVQRVHADLIRR